MNNSQKILSILAKFSKIKMIENSSNRISSLENKLFKFLLFNKEEKEKESSDKILDQLM